MINYGSFPGVSYFSCGFTYNELMKMFKKQKLSHYIAALESVKYLFDEDHTEAFVAQRKVGECGNDVFVEFIILKEKFDFSDTHHATLSHEIIHAVTNTLSDVLDIVKENEAFAYTHSHVLSQCYSLLKKKITNYAIL